MLAKARPWGKDFSLASEAAEFPSGLHGTK